jgi:hypothetical protein
MGKGEGVTGEARQTEIDVTHYPDRPVLVSQPRALP